MHCLSWLLLIFVLSATQVLADSALSKLDRLPSSSLLVVDSSGRSLHSKNPDQLFIPASTVKLLTALIALDHWGSDYRFSTNFYIDPATNLLWIEGLGDPYLVSEELDLIADRLHGLGVRQLHGVGVDTKYFGNDIQFDGHSGTENPYDAPVSALAANFNTIKIQVINGRARSGEPQTPITPLARSMASSLADGTHRVNLGQSLRSPQYFAEVLKAKMGELGVKVENKFTHDTIPAGSKLLFKHFNSRDLGQVVTSMLEYSNNFIANQLYLLLGAELYGAPTRAEKSQHVFDEYIGENFQWTNYVLMDGAGLSRKNQLSARQLVDVLQLFSKYRHVMPIQNKHILAKTGTLKRVSSYAGYLNRNQDWSMFALIINQPVGYFFRQRVAEELLQH